MRADRSGFKAIWIVWLRCRLYRLFCIMRTGRLFPPDIVCYWALPHFPHRARRSFSRTCFCRVSSRRDVTERQEVAERIGLAAERAFQCAQPEADDVCFLHSVKGVELSPVSIKRQQHNWATEEQKRYIRTCCRSGSRRRRLYRTGCQKYRSDLNFHFLFTIYPSSILVFLSV